MKASEIIALFVFFALARHVPVMMVEATAARAGEECSPADAAFIPKIGDTITFHAGEMAKVRGDDGDPRGSLYQIMVYNPPPPPPSSSHKGRPRKSVSGGQKFTRMANNITSVGSYFNVSESWLPLASPKVNDIVENYSSTENPPNPLEKAGRYQGLPVNATCTLKEVGIFKSLVSLEGSTMEGLTAPTTRARMEREWSCDINYAFPCYSFCRSERYAVWCSSPRLHAAARVIVYGDDDFVGPQDMRIMSATSPEQIAAFQREGSVPWLHDPYIKKGSCVLIIDSSSSGIPDSFHVRTIDVTVRIIVTVMLLAFLVCVIKACDGDCGWIIFPMLAAAVLSAGGSDAKITPNQLPSR